VRSNRQEEQLNVVDHPNRCLYLSRFFSLLHFSVQEFGSQLTVHDNGLANPGEGLAIAGSDSGLGNAHCSDD
jgi:hypothetical protein